MSDSKNTGEAPKLEYRRAFSFVTEHGKWMRNILLATVIQQVPFAGGLVFYGYLYDMIKDLHNGPAPEKKEPYLEFRPSEFSELMMKGIAPLVTTLVLVSLGGFVLIFLSGIVSIPVIIVFAPILIGLQEAGVNTQPIMDSFPPIALSIAGILCLPLVSAFMRPMVLRAGLMRKIDEAFKFGFVLDFFKRTWKEQFKVTLYLMLTVPIALALGILACFVGLYPAITWVGYAYAHFDYQIYEIYLARGGEPIPF